MTNQYFNRPIMGAIIAPLWRVWDSPHYTKVVAAVASMATAIREDALFLILVGLFFANLYDTFIGRVAAKHRKEKIDPDRARAGFLTKLTGLVLLCFIRYFEHWAATEQIKGLELTHGAAAAAIAAILFLMELESIEGHRVSLGGKPIPFFSLFLEKMRNLEGRILVAANPSAASPEPRSDP